MADPTPPPGYQLVPSGPPPPPPGYTLVDPKSAPMELRATNPVDAEADARVAKEAAAGFAPQPSVAKGLPFGSWLDEASAGIDAGLNKVTGGALGQPYDKAIAYQHARDRYIEKNAPTEQTVATIAGGLGTAGAFPALKLLPGAGILADAGNALMTAAGYGGLYGSGDDSGDGRSANALEGSKNALMFAAPLYPVARALGNALSTQAAKNPPMPAQLQNYDPRAVSTMADLFKEDELQRPITGYNKQRALLADQGMLMDMGPNMRAVGSALAKRTGPEMNTLVKAVADRRAGAEGRIDNAINQAMGKPVNVPQTIDQMKAAKRAAAAPLYDQFHNTSIPATPEIKSVLSQIPSSAFNKAQALAKADGYKQQFRLKPVDEPMTPMTGVQGTVREQIPTGLEYDYLKRAVDDLAGAAKPGSNEGRVYANLARSLRTTVDETLSPGNPTQSTWAMARSAAGEHLRLQQAFDDGQQAFSKKLSAEQMAYNMRGMSSEERQMYRLGARTQIRDVAENASTKSGANPDTAERSLLQSRNAQKKLNILVGNRSPATNLTRTLEAETRFDNTYQKALQNSDTALYQAAQKRVPGPIEADTNVHALTLEGAVATGAKKIIDTLTTNALTAQNIRHAADVARMLSAQGATRDDIASGLIQVINGRNLSPAQRADAYRAAAKVLSALAAGPNISERKWAASPTNAAMP